MKTKDEMNALKCEVENLKKKLTELNKDELEQIAGGDAFDKLIQWISSDWGYKSGATPKYTEGQPVRFYDGYNWFEGVIVSIDDRSAGIINTEYLYSVQGMGSTGITSGIFESNIQPRR